MSAQRPHLLVVDDDRAILTLVGTIAQTEGFDVSTTLDGVEALQLLRRRPADLVLLDLRMPGVTGLEILRSIRDITPRTHVALMSGYATIDNAVEAVKLIVGPMRKAANRLVEKAPGELRHALGLAVPYDEREYFYMRWFRDVEARYAPGPYHGPITLFASQGRVEKFRAMWADLAVGGLIVRDLPLTPDHSQVVLLPNSRFLAAQIDASLSELAAGRPVGGAKQIQ